MTSEQQRTWLSGIREGVNFLVKKGYSWTELNLMPSYRVRELITMNVEIDKKENPTSAVEVDSIKLT